MVLVGNSAKVLNKKEALKCFQRVFCDFYFKGFADNPVMNRWYLNSESECSVSNIDVFPGSWVAKLSHTHTQKDKRLYYL